MARIRAVKGHSRQPLTEGWELTSTPPGAAKRPSDLGAMPLEWRPAIVPGTVATALRRAGDSRFDRGGDDDLSRDVISFPDLESHDWWYRLRRTGVPGLAGRQVLRFDGLATVADVFLNDEPVHRSENMFESHAIDVTGRLRGDDEIAIRFAALAPLLAARRPRPRWRTRLVRDQNLRWFRTSFVGRMPCFGLDAPVVGPFRCVSLEQADGFAVDNADVRVTVEGAPGVEDGVVRATLRVTAIDPQAELRAATLLVDGGSEDGDGKAPLVITRGPGNAFDVTGELRVRRPELWWPHTHGQPHLYPARVVLDIDVGSRAGSPARPTEIEIDLGPVGFRRIETTGAPDGDDFGLSVNGVPVFCRGACWTSVDPLAVGGSRAEYMRALGQARDAGFNMLRVPGNTAYEQDIFYELCDELGILVWQDFMFANLDYPIADSAFAERVASEARQLVDRLQARPCLAVLCGGSEVAQQAAMLGLDREAWSSPLFSELLPGVARQLRPDVIYVDNSPSGGALPFEARRGVAHYYGVGAYLRPLEDARRAGVRFVSEGLAFANVPDRTMVETMLRPGEVPVHHPRWKAGVPRDVGAGWDFEDVRDHYLAELFHVDPVALRSSDMERYLQLSRVVSGEVMAATMTEWRRPGSTCRGALVWVYQDVVAGAGWGIVDSRGDPKPAYFALKRACRPILLAFSDEGLNGLDVHLVNDSTNAIDGDIEIAFLRDGRVPVASARWKAEVAPRSGRSWSVAAQLSAFYDTTYAYRFGPPSHDAAVATFRGISGDGPSAASSPIALHFPEGLPAERQGDLGLEATVVAIDEAGADLRLTTQRLALAVEIEVDGFAPADNYLHVSPGKEAIVRLRRVAVGATGATADLAPPKGLVTALNGAAPVRIAVAVDSRLSPP